MWVKSEIDALAKLYDELEEENLDYLPSEELRAIQNCGWQTVTNLRNWMLVPKHNKNPKTIRLTRLNTNLNLKTWLEKIEKTLAISFPMKIQIGYSFLAKTKEEIIFVFCPKALASYSATINSKSDFTKFLDEVKELKDFEHLQNTFLSTDTGSPFTTSGYRPHLLISNTIWITK